MAGKNGKGGRYSKCLENLFDFLEDAEGLSDEDLKEDLREGGIDPEALLARGKLIVEATLKEARLSWKKRAQEEIESFEQTMSSAKLDVPNSSLEAMQKIKRILGDMPEGNRSAYAQFYSNMNKLTEEEAISVYDDLQKLKLLEEKKEKESNERSGS
jgi:hypothetical protein